MEQGGQRRTAEWLVLAAFLAVVALVFQQIATSLTAQGAASGDPLSNSAMFPRLVAWVMLGLSALIAVMMLIGRMPRPGEIHAVDTTPDIPPEPEALRKGMLIGMIGAVVLYLLLLQPLGFQLATLALMTGLFALFGVRPWWRAVVAGAGITLLVSFVFEGILKVVLPTGVFGISLPLGLF
ncbi:tripartite tricarboxylate transporter TctB family protein [Marinibacterium profundimaris]|nr:tripartite tricarboxylate transporter TctB family protein [Marinibacterium profundimaris]